MSSSQRSLQECCTGQAVSKKSQQRAQMLSTQHKVPSPQCRWIRTERTMCAGFAARGRSGQQGRELHWSPVKFAAVRSSPWLRAGPTSPNSSLYLVVSSMTIFCYVDERPVSVENQNRFSPKVYTELLNTKRNARFTQCQNQWPHSV